MSLHATATSKIVNIDESEAARMYGPSVHWFRRARWKGNGPAFVKLAGRVLYPVAELDRYFEARLQRSTSDIKQPAAA